MPIHRMIFTILVTTHLFAGCKTQNSPGSTSQTESIIMSDELLAHTLLAKIFADSITVCLKEPVPATREQDIQSAIVAWTAPLRELTDKPIFKTVRLKSVSDAECSSTGAWDILLNPNYTSRSHFIVGKKLMQISTSDTYQIVLHEFGHAFGLADTYNDQIFGACQQGQPRSVMCGSKFGVWYFRNIGGIETLLPDDIRGIKAAFCKLYASSTEKCSSVPAAEPESNTLSTGEPRFRIDAEFSEGDSRCTEALFIKSVTPGTSTSRAGLKSGLCLKSINLQSTKTQKDLKTALSSAFSSFLNISVENSISSEEVDLPRFMAARDVSITTPPTPKVDDVVLGYKNAILKFDNGTNWVMPSNLPCQIRALRTGEVRIACHNIPGWTGAGNVDLISQPLIK